MSASLSVVICTYNRADSLRRAAETVIAQTAPGFSFELLIVDDASTDHTREVIDALARTAPNVRYAANDCGKGIAGARNSGVHAAQGDYIVFFDDDQLADPRWLIELLAVVRADGAKVVGGGRRLDLAAEEIASLGPVCRALLGESLYSGMPEVLRGKDLPTTGNLLIAREVFTRVGDFDTKLSAFSGEDAELIGRARAAGFDVWTAPRAIVAHMIPPYRTRPTYFRWVSRRWGVQFAQIDIKRHGRAGLLVLGAARAGQAALLHAPRWLLARLGNDQAAALDAQCLFWRAQGYLVKALNLIAPALFLQRRFLADLEFRNERQIFGESTPAPPFKKGGVGGS